jgi:serine protease Do
MQVTQKIVAGLAAIVALAVLTAAPPPVRAADKVVPGSAGEVTLSFAPLVKKAAPAVVNVYTRKVVQTRQISPLFDDPFFRRFFGEGFGRGFGLPQERVQNSLGSGVIVDSEGIIVTNHHVIDGADEITVVLADRREFAATVAGTDERTDLAVLRIDGKGEALPFLEFRDSDSLEVGDLVLAIGNPFGVGQTVTSGIVSALARTQVGISDLNFFIQTDAAINPGNSGGALITIDGKLVGINTAIFSKSGGSHGIGFAIPGNMVRSVIAGVTHGGRLVRPWLGATGQMVTAEIASSLGMSRPMGVLINEIHRSSPLRAAGIAVGDAIIAVDGQPVDDPQALQFRIATLAVGQTANLTVWRRGQERHVKLKLIAPPEDPPREVTEIGGANPLVGATVANMSPALAEELGLDAAPEGVFVIGLQRGATASRLGFKPGDRILAINGEETATVARLKAALSRPAERWRVSLSRAGNVLNWMIEK